MHSACFAGVNMNTWRENERVGIVALLIQLCVQDLLGMPLLLFAHARAYLAQTYMQVLLLPNRTALCCCCCFCHMIMLCAAAEISAVLCCHCKRGAGRRS
jgi:hypothetical protein